MATESVRLPSKRLAKEWFLNEDEYINIWFRKGSHGKFSASVYIENHWNLLDSIMENLKNIDGKLTQKPDTPWEHIVIPRYKLGFSWRRKIKWKKNVRGLLQITSRLLVRLLTKAPSRVHRIFAPRECIHHVASPYLSSFTKH